MNRLRNWMFMLFAAIAIAVFSMSAAASRRSHKKESRKGRQAESRNTRSRHGRSESRYESRRGRKSRDRYEARRDRKGSDRYESRRGRGRYEARRGRGRSRYEARYERRSRHSRSYRYYAEESTPSSSSAPAASYSGIPSTRITEIQKALIKAGYLHGDPSGQYDSDTTAAMKAYQTANGFTATGLPSAPALKKLGLPKASGDGYEVPVKRAVDSELVPSPSPGVLAPKQESGSSGKETARPPAPSGQSN